MAPLPFPALEEVDSATLEAARRGDEAAIERFVRVYQRRVFAFISRSAGRGPQVEDLAQEVFLRVFRALPGFQPRAAKVSTWIFQIAVHLLHDQRRRQARRGALEHPPSADDYDLPDGRDSPETLVSRRRALTRVERLVQELPDEQRMALVLFEFHGLSHEEIAEATNTNRATVKTRIHRARSTLRNEMSQKERGT